jgi:hypothetical protein
MCTTIMITVRLDSRFPGKTGSPALADIGAVNTAGSLDKIAADQRVRRMAVLARCRAWSMKRDEMAFGATDARG